MKTGIQRVERVVVAIALAALMVIFGFLVSVAAYATISEWSSIGVALSACAVMWGVAGPVMVFAGLWILVSLGRHPLPLRVGGVAAVLAGTVWIVGVLSYVIPCSSPS